MYRIDPRTLNGPRAYFTDFDHRIIDRTVDLEKLKRNGERKIKALLLVKSNIIFAASHLASDFVYQFFKENPELLNTGIIIPALRSDKDDISEIFQNKEFENKNNAIQFYKDNIVKTVDWPLEENSSWFKERFLEELNDEKSVVRSHISIRNQDKITSICNKIKNSNVLDRGLIDDCTRDLSTKERTIIQISRELLYHISGARVVNCESALPQENYIDYDITDLTQKRSRLSEDQILSKLLIEYVCDSLQKYMVSYGIIDNLSFHDIIQIRKPLLESKFQLKYNDLISGINKIHLNEFSKIFSINELETIRKDLDNTFRVQIQEELPKHMKHRALKQAKQLGSISVSFALNIVSFISGFGNTTNYLSLFKDSPALLMNIGQTFNSLREINNQEYYYTQKEKAIRNLINKKDINDKTVFIDMVDLLASVISERLKL